ncbi:MAG: hypothetical protein NC336_00410 [Clostridium sp.]|nr:hypothetical protein [Clostridium sp.]
MKAKTTICVLSSATIMVVGLVLIVSYIKQNQDLNTPFLLENIEALAQGEDGTPAGDCYEPASNPNDIEGRLEIPCDERTTDNMIYPCKVHLIMNKHNEHPIKCTK